MEGSKFYINEENLGTEGTEGQARHMVECLQAEGFNVEYGDSLLNEMTDTEQVEFDTAFYRILEFAIT